MALFGKKKGRAPKQRAAMQQAGKAQKASARKMMQAGAPKAASPRQMQPAQQQAAAPQNGLFIAADGRAYLFHRTMGYRPLQKKHIDAAVMSAFGSK